MSREQYNADYIQQLSAREIQALLLNGFSTDYFPELQTSAHRDITKELNDAFQLLTPEQQEAFREGLLAALQDAIPPFYEAKVMNEIIFLAAFTRTGAVVGHLNSLLEPNSPLAHLNSDQKARSEEIVQAVLRGFEE